MAIVRPILGPLCCWMSILRSFRPHQPAARSYTTSQRSKTRQLLDFPPSIPHGTPPVKQRIKTYPPPPTPVTGCKEPILALNEDQIRILDPTGARTNLFARSNPESAKVGDILLVRLKTGDPFAGVCINIRRRSVETAILLRNQLTRVGVEMWYKIYSPNVEGIEVVQRIAKRARRERLTFMRKPTHDRGSVQNIVLQYQRTNGAIKGSAGRAEEGLKGGKRKIAVKGKGKKR